MSGDIDYGGLMHNAMRSLIRQVLLRVAAEGLPGAHHFYISIDTTHDGVEISDWLRERYPHEMTIVIENWFDDLQVDENGFAITLNFSNSPERLHVPYDSLKTFVDPSVEFGLRFESAHIEDFDDDADEFDEDDEDDIQPRDDKKGEVVSLDQFRKP